MLKLWFDENVIPYLSTPVAEVIDFVELFRDYFSVRLRDVLPPHPISEKLQLLRDVKYAHTIEQIHKEHPWTKFVDQDLLQEAIDKAAMDGRTPWADPNHNPMDDLRKTHKNAQKRVRNLPIPGELNGTRIISDVDIESLSIDNGPSVFPVEPPKVKKVETDDKEEKEITISPTVINNLIMKIRNTEQPFTDEEIGVMETGLWFMFENRVRFGIWMVDRTFTELEKTKGKNK